MCENNLPNLSFSCCYIPTNEKICCLQCLTDYVISEISLCVANKGIVLLSKYHASPLYIHECSILHSWFFFTDEPIIRCPMCRAEAETMIYGNKTISLKCLINIGLIHKTCLACLHFKQQGIDEEGFRRRSLVRMYILPNVLALAGLRAAEQQWCFFILYICTYFVHMCVCVCVCYILHEE